jgi:hypothetical protein
MSAPLFGEPGLGQCLARHRGRTQTIVCWRAAGVLAQLQMAIFLLSVSLGASCPPSACNGFGNSMCPGAAVLESKPIWPLGPKNLWFRNVAKWAVEVMVVSPEGDEESRGVLAPEVRRPHAAVHGEV